MTLVRSAQQAIFGRQILDLPPWPASITPAESAITGVTVDATRRILWQTEEGLAGGY